MRRWNCEERKFEEYSVPENWQVGLYSHDQDKLTDCAKCGKTLKYSQKYRSLEVMDDKGREYAVCKGCFKEEWVRKQTNITRTKFVELEENYMDIDDGER